MKIRTGTIKKNVTAYGNKFYIQLEDTETDDHGDLSDCVGLKVDVILVEKEKQQPQKGGKDE